MSAPEPSAYEPAPAPVFGGGTFRSDNASETETPADSDDNPWDAGYTETVESIDPPAPQPVATEDAPADDVLFGDAFDSSEPAESTEPAEEVEAFEPPAEEDLFADEPAEEPAAPAEDAAPADDLFGDDGFGDDAFGDDAGDLFDEPAADEPAADPEMAEESPADEAADDLFGEEAAEEPEAPADANDDEDVGDLFGGDDFGDEAFGDDAFGGDAPSEEPMEEAVPAAAEETAPPADEPAAEEADDLFGAPDEGDDAEGDDEFDDLFGGFGAILREPGGVGSTVQRTWVDDTGRHSCVGRLVAIDEGSVRLLKHGGKTAVVPLARLSQADLQFVSRQAVAQYEVEQRVLALQAKPQADEAPQQASADAELPFRTAQL